VLWTVGAILPLGGGCKEAAGTRVRARRPSGLRRLRRRVCGQEASTRLAMPLPPPATYMGVRLSPHPSRVGQVGRGTCRMFGLGRDGGAVRDSGRCGGQPGQVPLFAQGIRAVGTALTIALTIRPRSPAVRPEARGRARRLHLGLPLPRGCTPPWSTRFGGLRSP
jgi:hypothetical protein